MTLFLGEQGFTQAPESYTALIELSIHTGQYDFPQRLQDELLADQQIGCISPAPGSSQLSVVSLQ